MLNYLVMEWGQVLTIIFGISGFMSIFVFLINKRIDSVEKRIDSLEKRVEAIEMEMRELRKEIMQELKEIRELIYKVLGAERES